MTRSPVMRREAALLRLPRDVGMSRVVACGLHRYLRARLIDALRGRAELLFVDSLDDLIGALRRSADVADVVIVPPPDIAGPDAEDAVRQIVREHRRTAIVACCQPTEQHSPAIQALTAAGVHDFILTGVNDEGVVLRDLLVRARRQCAAEWLMRELEPLIPADLRSMAEVTLTHPEVVKNIPTLAVALEVHPRTLHNRCARAGFVSPGDLLAWCRLALVAYHLDGPPCTMQALALEVSYPSPTALRNTLKRYTGFTARTLRERGAVSTVIAAFARRLAR